MHPTKIKKMYIYDEVIRFEDLKKLVMSDQYNTDNINGKYARSYIDGNMRKAFVGVTYENEIEEIAQLPVTFLNENAQDSNRWELQPAVSGSIVNMDAFLQGEPEDMYTFVPSDANIVIDLDLFISLRSEVTAAEIKNAGEKVMLYIQNKPPNVFFNVTVTSSGTYFKGTKRAKHSKVKVILSLSDSYITNEAINYLCTPLLYRYFILKYCTITESRSPDLCPADLINFMTFDKNTYE